MRVNLHPCFVLHTRPYRESSLLVDLLTHNHGRITAVARSARGPKSRFRGVIQPFFSQLISWSGKTDLMNINAIDVTGLPYQLSGQSLICGLYLNELLVRLLHRFDASPKIFDAYQTALNLLQNAQQIEQSLRIFEKTLLIELGYGLPLEKDCFSGEHIKAEEYYSFDAQQGFTRVDGYLDNQSVLFSGKNLIALHQAELVDQDDLKAAKKIMRLALLPLLGNKPLKSRELF